MDLLFSKYASPYSFMDDLISNGDFFDWVVEFVNAENEKQIWEMWLHKVFDKSFEEFRKSVLKTQSDYVSDEQIETTISNSKEMLNNFIPAEQGVKHGTI